jgi:hypothetical protein
MITLRSVLRYCLPVAIFCMGLLLGHSPLKTVGLMMLVIVLGSAFAWLDPTGFTPLAFGGLIVIYSPKQLIASKDVDADVFRVHAVVSSILLTGVFFLIFEHLAKT